MTPSGRATPKKTAKSMMSRRKSKNNKATIYFDFKSKGQQD